MSVPSLMPQLSKITWSSLQKNELLGNGSYGNVFHGTWNGKEVAIKELVLKKLPEKLIADFENETKIMASCQSERIVQLFGACLEMGHYALVMEYMPKGSLYQLLQDSKIELPWSLRWRFALEIGEGLSYLHQKDIIHRDLKSLNILLNSQNQCKISDFGLSTIKQETSSTSTNTKQPVGTVRWQAPELFKRKAVQTKASDVYSYGMLLWEIASRKIPFSDAPNETTAAVWIQQGEKEEIPSDSPAAYGELIKRSWSQEPAERPLIDILIKAIQSAMPPLPISEKSWHFDSASKTFLDNKKYDLLPATAQDIQKVLSFYNHHPVPGYHVSNVKVIHNPGFNRGFELHMAKLQERHQNSAFEPKWNWEPHPEWRQKVDELFKQMAKPYTDPDYPNVNLLPLWHGTRSDILDSILRSGFANLATTDAGFFGKGLYSTFEAEYAYRVYSQGTLLLNWVAIYSAYPTIDGDMGKLTGKANYQNYDAHFVPVVPKTSNPNESTYFPAKPQQKHTYTEVVVFESAACLPRYVVELQAILTKQLAFLPSSSAPAQKHVYANPISAPKMESLIPPIPKVSDPTLSVKFAPNHELIFTALEAKDFEKIAKLLKQENSFFKNHNSKSISNLGWGRIQFAVALRRIDIVQDLYKQNPSIIQPKKNSSDHSLFDIAALTGSLEVAKWLIKQDLSLLKKADQPVENTLYYGWVEFAEWLVHEDASLWDDARKRGAKLLEGPIRYGLKKALAWLIEKDSSLLQTVHSYGGYTPLHTAACYGQLDLAKWIVQRNSSLLTKVRDGGWTALHDAASCNDEEEDDCDHIGFVKWLVQMRPSLLRMVDNTYKSTALHEAASHGNMEIVKCLIQQDPKLISMKKKDGQTAREIAKQSGFTDIAKWIKNYKNSL